MDTETAIVCLGALAQPTRIEAFRLLVAHEPEGIAAGEIARLIGVPQNTMSAHLSILANCGLVASTRHARSIRYRADLPRLQALVVFLLQDCCGGRADVCSPVLQDLAACCSNPKKRKEKRRA